MPITTLRLSMVSSCPRCGTIMDIKEFANSESCPSCGYDFSRFNYIIITVICILCGGLPWLLVRDHFRKQWDLAYGLSWGIFAFGVVQIAGGMILQSLSVPKVLRRRVLPWVGVGAAFITAKIILA